MERIADGGIIVGKWFSGINDIKRITYDTAVPGDSININPRCFGINR
jgi:hypothetical protein